MFKLMSMLIGMLLTTNVAHSIPSASTVTCLNESVNVNSTEASTSVVELSSRATVSTTSGKLVFAHYMLLTEPTYSYADDIKRAMAAGIDAFAVNYGGWSNDFNKWDTYLKQIFAAAETAKFKLFLTWDMTSVKDPNMIVRLQNQYAKSPSQLYYNNRLFMSTFDITDNPNFNWKNDVLNKIVTSNGNKVYFVPGTTQGSAKDLFARSYVDGVFNWIHPGDTYSSDLARDKTFNQQRDATKKTWMQGIAPWFYKHYPQYNWGNVQDNKLFYNKFRQYANPTKGCNPDFIQLVTWNDFGESSYFGPPNVKGDLEAYATLNHNAMLDLTSYFIRWYKSGKQPIITTNKIYWYYITQPKDNRGSNDPVGIPQDAAQMINSINVVAMLTKATTITVTNGGKTVNLAAPAGLSQLTTPFKVGSVSIKAGSLGGNTGVPIVQNYKIYNANIASGVFQ